MQNARLKQLRTKLNLSQEELGNAIGITRSGVSSIESGARKLSDKHIKLLLAAYPCVNEGWLRTGAGEMFIESDASILGELTAKFHLDDLDVCIIEHYLKLPAAHREIIKNYVCGLTSD